jgi:acetylornithine deacetylase
VVEWLARLVALDTTSARSNRPLIGLAADLLGGLGADLRFTVNDSGDKANLFATLGPSDRPGLVLSGHTDTVPVDGQDWRHPPYALTAEGERLYGRGTADMKGFLAICLALAPEIAARRLDRPVHFALSYDEEIGCVGVRRLLADLAARPVLPRFALIGEPTRMQVVSGHKGKASVSCRVEGLACHSALNHLGVNAVEVAAELVARLRALQHRLRGGGPFDPAYTPPYTTVHTGTIKGGTALNIVPDRCAFDFEIRNLPDQDPGTLMAEIRGWAQDLIPEMLAVSEEAGIYFDEFNVTAGLSTPDDDPWVALIARLVGAESVHRVAFTTEAGLFQKAGVPALVCGPGDIAQAHRADEFITLDQLARGEHLVRALVDHLAGPD